MNKIETRRRLCLTGTPIQNNLKECMNFHIYFLVYFLNFKYLDYTMVNFVKPGLLGTKNEFDIRFNNIISRGQSKEADAYDVRRMKRRCHVLYEHLRGVVQRRGYQVFFLLIYNLINIYNKYLKVLVQTIPPKQEYVIYVRLTNKQCQLYRAYLKIVFSPSEKKTNPQVLRDYYILSRIWTHPFLLILHEKEVEKKRLFQDDINFCVSDESSICSLSSSSSTNDLS